MLLVVSEEGAPVAQSSSRKRTSNVRLQLDDHAFVGSEQQLPVVRASDVRHARLDLLACEQCVVFVHVGGAFEGVLERVDVEEELESVVEAVHHPTRPTNTCFRLARLELGQIVVVGGRALRHDASESEVRVREGGEEVVACVDRKINCRHRS